LTDGFLTFALISGTGWVLDLVVTVVLVNAGLAPFWASLIGAALAVTFVYFMSRVMVFETSNLGQSIDYVFYMGWQVVAITLASYAVAKLSYALEPIVAARRDMTLSEALAIASGIGKVLVTPVTLIANFLFLRWLSNRNATATGES